MKGKTWESIDSLLMGKSDILLRPLTFSDYRMLRIVAYAQPGETVQLTAEEYAAATRRTLKNLPAQGKGHPVPDDSLTESVLKQEVCAAATNMIHYDECGIVTTLPLYDLMQYDEGTGIISARLSAKVSFLHDYFTATTRRSEYYLHDLCDLPSLRLYDELTKYAGRHTLNYNLKWLARVLCIQPEAAKWKNIKPVLDDAVSRINERTDLRIEYSELCNKARAGRPVEGVSLKLVFCDVKQIQEPDVLRADIFSAVFPACYGVGITKTEDVRSIISCCTNALTKKDAANPLKMKMRIMSNARVLRDALTRGPAIKNKTAWLCAAIRDNYAARQFILPSSGMDK